MERASADIETLLAELEPYRDEFAALVGEPVPDMAFEAVVREYAVYAYDFNAFVDAGAVDSCRRMLPTFKRARQPKRREETPFAPSPRDEDPRWAALAEILALEAAEDPYVRAWRKEILNGELVSRENVWHTLVHLGNRDRALARERGDYRTPEDDSEPVVAPERFRLHFRDEKGRVRHRPFVFRYGALGGLEHAAKQLETFYSWAQADAVTFVLTGTTPPYAWLYGRYEIVDGRAATTRVRIECDPRVSRKDVVSLYESARERLAERGVPVEGSARPLKRETAELALFAARRRGARWREIREAWNAEHPNRKYGSERELARDVRRAYFRVVGGEYEHTTRENP